MRALTGTAIERWLDIELPKVQNPRLDLLGETTHGELLHLELQSTNDSLMPLRMAEYSLGVLRQTGRLPQQILLYVGESPLRMETELRGPEVWFRYSAIDVRELDGEELLQSDDIGDNVIAILAKLRDRKLAVRKIVTRLIDLPGEQRRAAFDQLVILAGLRKMAREVAVEVRTMPIQIDLMENEVIAEYYQRGRQEGRQEGELALLRRQIEKRFGTIPAWAEEKLAAQTTAQLEQVSVRLLEVTTLEDLLG